MVETRDGRPHGPSEIRDERGRLIVKGRCHAGQPHGIFECYDEDGGLLRRASFQRGVEVWSGTGSVPWEHVPLPLPDRVPPLATDDFIATDRVSPHDRVL